MNESVRKIYVTYAWIHFAHHLFDRILSYTFHGSLSSKFSIGQDLCHLGKNMDMEIAIIQCQCETYGKYNF